MAKTKKKRLNKISVAFRKGRKEYTATAYREAIEKTVYQLEELGLDIAYIYFSKSSESVYVTFKVDSYNETRLNLTDKNYLGHFIISSHQRYYHTVNKTFLTTQTANMDSLAKEMKTYFNEMLADKKNAHSYFMIVSNKELDVLRLMATTIDKKQHFEVLESQLSGTGIVDLFVVTDKRQPVTIISDKVSSDFVRGLLTKGCVKAFSPGCQGRVIMQFTNLADLLLAEYGEKSKKTLEIGYNNRNTFDLWVHPQKLVEYSKAEQEVLPRIKVSPTAEQLQTLKIDKQWYTELDSLAQDVTTKELLSSVQREQWTDMLADFMDKHLPDNRELITQQIPCAHHKGVFYIAEETEQETLPFYPVVLAPTESLTTTANVTIPFEPHQTYELLQHLVTACTMEPMAVNNFTEKDILSYVASKNLDRQGIQLGISATGKLVGQYQLNGHRYREIVKRTPELLVQAKNLYESYKELYLWTTTKVPLSSAVCFKPNHTLENIMDYALSVMPYIADSIVSQNKRVIPMVPDYTTMTINMYTVSELILLE